MKRLLVYFSVLVGCLFVGLTTYYMLKDYDIFFPETQGVSAEADYNLNVGETAEYKFAIDKKSDDTEMLYSFDNEGIATYDMESGVITAVKGGTTTLKVYTNKENLGFYECSIVVGDGSDNSAWIIDSQEDLASIGKTREFPAATVEWKLSDNYELLNDIELNGEWTPIGGTIVGGTIRHFTGKFNGNHHTIKNLTMTQDFYYAGLFGAVGEMATVSSVKLDNVNITGYYLYGGSLIGLCEGAEIKGVEVTNANITINAKTNEMLNWFGMDENNIGGIIGLNRAFIDGDIVHHSKISLTTFDGNIKLTAPNTVKTDYSVGGILGYNLGAEIHNNKAVVNFEIASGIANFEDEAQIAVGGVVGTSYLHNPDNKTFSANKDKEVVYAIIMNNLVVMNFDNAPVRAGGIVGHFAVATKSEIMKHVSGCTLTDEEIDSIISTMRENAVSRITGNMYHSYGKELTSRAGCEEKSLEALKLVATYNEKAWAIATPETADEGNFAWVIVDGEQIAAIDYEGSNEEHSFSLTTIELNQENFADYVAKMLDNTSAVAQKYWLSREYKLTSDIDLAELFPTWAPISYRETDPTFSGIFDGNGFAIKNVNIVNRIVDSEEVNFASVGLFASIGTTGVVKNLKIENVEIDFAKIGGVIAGVNYGLIENCQVTGVHINDALTAGFVVGHNKGIIRTTKTISEEDSNLQYTVLADMEGENSIANLKTLNAFLGGIAGYNTGKIVGARIEANFKLDGATVPENVVVTKMIGGIAGYNGGEIILSSVENANIKDLSKGGNTYLGGIAGLTNGLIDRCHAGLTGDGYSTSITGEVNAAQSLVGGITGQLSIGGRILQSFVKADITAHYVGGIAANLFGYVKECYVMGTITGEYVGGISVNVSLSDKQSSGGHVEDCYVRATLKGYTENAKVAGLSTYLLHPGKFERVVLMVNYGGLGNKYFESFTDTRTGFYNFVNSFAGTKLGKVYNIIIDNSIVSAEDKVAQNGGAINYEGQTVYYTNTETIQSGESFYVDKEFSMNEGGVWFITAGVYPELRNVNLDGNAQNVVAEEGTEDSGETSEEGAEDSGEASEEGFEEQEGAGEVNA